MFDIEFMKPFQNILHFMSKKERNCFYFFHMQRQVIINKKKIPRTCISLESACIVKKKILVKSLPFHLLFIQNYQRRFVLEITEVDYCSVFKTPSFRSQESQT